MSILLWAIGIYLFFVFGWVLYAAIMKWREVLPKLHWFPKVNAYAVLIFWGYPVDAIMNGIVCLFLWWKPQDFLLTGTLQRIKNTTPNESNRCIVASWICTHMLNPIDEAHC